MPLYTYQVVDEHDQPTGEEFDKLFSISDRPDALVSSEGRRAIRKQVYDFARTELSWGKRYGTVNGEYNRGLGCYVEDYAHEKRIAKERGLVRVSEVESEIDKVIHKQKAIKEQTEKDAQDLERITNHGMSRGLSHLEAYTKATEEVWNAERCLSDNIETF